MRGLSPRHNSRGWWGELPSRREGVPRGGAPTLRQSAAHRPAARVRSPRSRGPRRRAGQHGSSAGSGPGAGQGDLVASLPRAAKVVTGGEPRLVRNHSLCCLSRCGCSCSRPGSGARSRARPRGRRGRSGRPRRTIGSPWSGQVEVRAGEPRSGVLVEVQRVARGQVVASGQFIGRRLAARRCGGNWSAA